MEKAACRKQSAIKNACQLSFNGYQKYAFGHDQVKPVSQTSSDLFQNIGMTIVDSIDTLFIMGLTSEYQAARDWISSSLSSALNRWLLLGPTPSQDQRYACSQAESKLSAADLSRQMAGVQAHPCSRQGNAPVKQSHTQSMALIP